MAFSETDRTWVRHFMGFSAIWLQADPRLENALTAAQSVADGGSRPDSSGENYVKALIYGQAAVAGTAGVTVGPVSTTGATFASPAQRGLIQIEASIAAQDAFMGALSVDGGEAKIHPAGEMVRLRMEGRRLVGAMCRMIGMKGPRVDVFSTMQGTEDVDPFWASESPFWP